ncbi:hypothetical protein AAY473_008780 [Plecturocebus cupreus]
MGPGYPFLSLTWPCQGASFGEGGEPQGPGVGTGVSRERGNNDAINTLLGTPLFESWETRLECSGVIMVHHRIELLGSSDPPTSASQVAGTIGSATTPGFVFCYCFFVLFCFGEGVLLYYPGRSQTPGVKQSSHFSLLKS